MAINIFISELKKLRESSKYAVADGNLDNLDSFKQYLHIERPVEQKLKEIIVNASTCSNGQLILVCGNVGDGKSHILSYLHGVIGDEIGQFIIHNDATESHNPNETSNDTLCRLLSGFKDDSINSTKDKIILAINLGTLSKFLEDRSTEFNQLKEYVDKNKILDNVLAEESAFDNTQHIHHVNFTDYHLYSLSEQGAISDTISTLLEKIVNDSKDNSIYQAYLAYKEVYKSNRYCPILYNYEFLINNNNRDIITQLIVKCIVKSKEIVSVRTLLNYMYDIIVPFELASLSEETYLERLELMKPKEYLALLIPNYLFEHEELSKLFEKIADLDPCDLRKEEIDSILLKLANTEQPIVLYNKHIASTYTESLTNLDHLLTGASREDLSKFFIRLNFFSNYNTSSYLQDKKYEEYLEWLFHYNNSNTIYIQKIYALAILAIKKWNGDTKSDNKVIINVGRQQNKYRIFKEVAPQPYFYKKAISDKKLIHRFKQEFSIEFDIESDKPITVNIDYGLFVLLQKIASGYRPNKKDNNNYVYFVQSTQKITNHKSAMSPLYIDEVNIGKSIDYKFSKQIFDGYTFELI
ncbi:DNA phosphorothioation-dependent restriction protein DptF [Sphingobacterium multivorum]|uniref:DNA phosphorothioation-dependent restriction protein DptF n=1 Tax=Sphingobacterium multivorum TaxID=28454 RepID=UPI0028A865A3|nr:DNA phosphorothioation-dependent restriction protein DptF [Sphingobacterium multivorum]